MSSVESEGLEGSLHKNEQIIVSLLVGGGYPQAIGIQLLWFFRGLFFGGVFLG